jgi:hypothetical protein
MFTRTPTSKLRVDDAPGVPKLFTPMQIFSGVYGPGV